MMGMPALRMRDGDPAENLREFPILSRPEKEMPVIGHQIIGGNANLGLSPGFGENLLKGGVVSGLLKERQPSHAMVQGVISKVSGSEVWAARHREVSAEIGVSPSGIVSRSSGFLTGHWPAFSSCTPCRLNSG